jgi:hypothetical protein
MFSYFTKSAFSQALVTPTIVRAPTGHKKTASSEWGGNRKSESQNATETAATAFQSFRRAAGWAVPRIIHWWLIAFTVQNYGFLFRCHNLPAKNIFIREISRQAFGPKTRQYHALYRFYLVRKTFRIFQTLARQAVAAVTLAVYFANISVT